MRTAVILLWASCLWTIARSALCFALTASPWRRLLVLAALLLAVARAHKPGESAARLKAACGKNDEEASCNPDSVVVK